MTEFILNLEEIDLREVYGVNNSRIIQFKEQFPGVSFLARGNELKVRGSEDILPEIKEKIAEIIDVIRKLGKISEEKFQEVLFLGSNERSTKSETDVILHGTGGNIIRARTEGQMQIVNAVKNNDLVFAIGPAGTGKTYTAVAMAVKALKEKRVKKIILTRPAVEAGESLGFLPGDLREKIDPYLRPLYDALEDMIHFEKLRSLIERNTIEVAPLAYMRGRTLSNAFIILDEAQNATEMQIKMFLTRMGRESKIVVTGDDSQTDLPRNMRSGLLQGVSLLTDVEGVAIVRMSKTDIVRHGLVRKIIHAYEQMELRKKEDREKP